MILETSYGIEAETFISVQRPSRNPWKVSAKNLGANDPRRLDRICFSAGCLLL
jgi:hypothetical protein